MLCSNCKKRPATHFTGDNENINGLCDECFERLGAAVEFSGGSPDMFPADKEETPVCPVCGLTFEEYRQTGLVGCAACYDAFRKELMPVIRGIHGKTTHEGKRPLGSGKMFELIEEQKRLRAELESAIREKRKQDADRLNRDIREISRMIGRGMGGEDGQ